MPLGQPPSPPSSAPNCQYHPVFASTGSGTPVSQIIRSPSRPNSARTGWSRPHRKLSEETGRSWICKRIGNCELYHDTDDESPEAENDSMEQCVPLPAGFLQSVKGMENPVFMIGGDRKNESGIHVFDPATQTWKTLSTKGSPPQAHCGNTVTVLGRKIVVYGNNTRDPSSVSPLGKEQLGHVFVLDISSMKWGCHSISGALPRQHHSATLLDSRRLMIYGGLASIQRDLIVLDLEAKKIVEPRMSGEAPPNRQRHSATLSSRSVVVIFGGQIGGVCVNDLIFVDWIANAWVHPTTSGCPPSPRQGHTACSIDNNSVVFFGGCDHWGQQFCDLHILETDRLEWSKLPLSGDPFLRDQRFSLFKMPGFDPLIIFGSSCTQTSVHTLEKQEQQRPPSRETPHTSTDRTTRSKSGRQTIPVDSRVHIRSMENCLGRMDRLLLRMNSAASGEADENVGIEEYARQVHSELLEIRKECAARIAETAALLLFVEEPDAALTSLGNSESPEGASRRAQMLEARLSRMQRHSVRRESELLSLASTAIKHAQDLAFSERLEGFLDDVSCSGGMEIPESLVYCHRHGVRRGIPHLDTSCPDAGVGRAQGYLGPPPRTPTMLASPMAPMGTPRLPTPRSALASPVLASRTPPKSPGSLPSSSPTGRKANPRLPSQPRSPTGRKLSQPSFNNVSSSSSAWMQSLETALDVSEDTPSNRVKLWALAAARLQEHMRAQSQAEAEACEILERWQDRKKQIDSEMSSTEHLESEARELAARLRKRVSALEADVIQSRSQLKCASRTAVVALAQLHQAKHTLEENTARAKDAAARGWRRLAKRCLWRSVMSAVVKTLVRKQTFKFETVAAPSGHGKTKKKKIESLGVKDLVKQNDDLRLQVASLGTLREGIQKLTTLVNDCSDNLDENRDQGLLKAINSVMLQIRKKAKYVVEEGFVDEISNRLATERNKATVLGKEAKVLESRLVLQQDHIKDLRLEATADKLVLASKLETCEHELQAARNHARQLESQIKLLETRQQDAAPPPVDTPVDYRSAIASRDSHIEDLEQALEAERSKHTDFMKTLQNAREVRREVEAAFLELFEQVRAVPGGPCALLDSGSVRHLSARNRIQERRATEDRDAAYALLQSLAP